MSRVEGDLTRSVHRQLANARVMVEWWEGRDIPDLADPVKAAAARQRVAQLERIQQAAKADAHA